jgi:hypothetical protein
MKDKLSSRRLAKMLQELKERKYDKSIRGQIDESVISDLKTKERQIMDAIAQRKKEELALEGRGRLIKGKEGLPEGMSKVTGPRDVIDTKSRLPQVTGDEFSKKIARKRALMKMGKIAGKGLKSIPVIGGVLSALASGDASAAIPVLGK